MNYYETARTNTVKIKDMEGLIRGVGKINLEINERDDGVCFLAECGWPEWTADEDGNETSFDPETDICPYMEEDQVLVIMSSGYEGVRYVTGWAKAYNAKGESVYIELEDIYDKACKEFNLPAGSIKSATY